ncbi:mycofactocin-coupled SDR family oxidoreductase [Pseudonocardia sp. KRD291]|uniref:mycofactocin-coupled SDR family oxidoreductase n=1 Tax=Pseudonocardia sp. KRD291 TaxID=2792007 RepID=UPI001C49FF00|nr:mycofactocin-coupled SDR family oxidoreductase [Pseudonocardia sp. KRD291]MBW0103462.1 mycofactocin-coupled SDR family oxidoreductase [Pseudonocardia sp. KRD291]
MGKLDGKVALITGAGRGQGRAHAVKLAAEGADIIALDICAPIASVPYELSSRADLDETAKLVEQLDRRVVARPADVRDRAAVTEAVQAGASELGRLDIVVANAGIWSAAPFVDMTDEMFDDMIDVQMYGPYNTCRAAVPILLEQGTGGSIVIISSTAGLRGFPNQVHYNMGKHAVVGLMRTLANELAPHFIRANTIHPSSTNTKMIQNEAIWSAFAPGVENPTVDDFGATFTAMNLLPIPWMEPEDISDAVAWLASDESRYVTGVTLPVDAGFMAKYN